MLVVNVTWRNKTYVGTLLDCTQHDWAPPRYSKEAILFFIGEIIFVLPCLLSNCLMRFC